jgi:succinate dehydrogenase/fumarate reductase flavoprotein subunit
MTPRHVVVCGAGLAGLAAAVSAAQAGARVTLIEKSPGIGGTTFLSQGRIWTYDTLDQFRELSPRGDFGWHRLLHRDMGVDLDWLAECGVVVRNEEHGIFGHGWGRNIDPAQGLNRLLELLQRNGGIVQVNTSLDSLRIHNGKVNGLRVVTPAGDVEERDADAVILATGGFQGNIELLRRYVIDSPQNLYLRANSWSTGDGLLSALGAGAGVTAGLETFYGHAMIAPPAHLRPIESDLNPATQRYGPRSIAINLAGHRFVDEYHPTGEQAMNQVLARQPGGLGFYVIDATILDDVPLGPTRRSTKDSIAWARQRGAPIAEGQSLAEVAQSLGPLGVSAHAALTTFEQFNSACMAGTAHRLTPPRTGYQTPLTRPPFIAVGVKASITYTGGGIACDTDGRVLRRSASTSPLAALGVGEPARRESPIPGLFAAGADVGNIHNHAYVGGLATALVTGRRAGRFAAACGSSTSPALAYRAITDSVVAGQDGNLR